MTPQDLKWVIVIGAFAAGLGINHYFIRKGQGNSWPTILTVVGGWLLAVWVMLRR
jgi:hypothetical protein